MKTIFIIYLVSVLVAVVLIELFLFIVQKILKYREIKLGKGSDPILWARFQNWFKCLIPFYNIVLSLGLFLTLCSKESMDKMIEQLIEIRGTEKS